MAFAQGSRSVTTSSQIAWPVWIVMAIGQRLVILV